MRRQVSFTPIVREELLMYIPLHVGALQRPSFSVKSMQPSLTALKIPSQY